MISAKEAFAVSNQYDALFKKHAEAKGLDWLLLKAIAWQESAFRPNVIGDGGAATGLFQINTKYLNIANLGFMKHVDLKDPDTNTAVAAALIADNKRLLLMRGIEPTALRLAAAYNGGVDEIANNGRISTKAERYAFTVTGRRDWLAMIS
jgi:soluble lytic murein transglycosylase-like protein